MADFTFGFMTTGVNTEIPITIEGITRANSAEIAELRDETGKVAVYKAFSVGYTISINGAYKVTTGVEIPVAGDTLTIGGKTYIIESVDVTEANNDFVKLSVSAKTADSAVILAD